MSSRHLSTPAGCESGEWMHRARCLEAGMQTPGRPGVT